MAREATLRANNEQRAVELPLDEPDEMDDFDEEDPDYDLDF
jgi:hypothetical protein